VANLEKCLNLNTAIDDKILVINCGSSTLKYKLLDITDNQILLKGVFEGIEQPHVQHSYEWLDNLKQSHQTNDALFNADYAMCFNIIAEVIKTIKCQSPTAVGHRVVHGGEEFIKPTLINTNVIAKIERLSALAPLHNPINLQGIALCLDLFPNVPHIAIFDTAFHQTMPDYAYRYPIAESWYSDHDIRKYGFHGTSHQYVAQQAANYLQKPLAKLNLISLHLGNGDSVTAIQQGQCIDTSMGFTPLAGLMMGTRCGDIDPAIPLYMQQTANMSPTQVSDELNHQSGLLAVAGSQDMREILKQSKNGDHASELALNMYCSRIKKYIGAYLALLGHVDAIIFTAGVGENSAEIRSRCCQQLESLGINFDADLNEQAMKDVSIINTSKSPIKLFVIKTNEERQIANEVSTFIKELNN
jgi:acetate kinase